MLVKIPDIPIPVLYNDIASYSYVNTIPRQVACIKAKNADIIKFNAIKTPKPAFSFKYSVDNGNINKLIIDTNIHKNIRVFIEVQRENKPAIKLKKNVPIKLGINVKYATEQEEKDLAKQSIATKIAFHPIIVAKPRRRKFILAKPVKEDAPINVKLLKNYHFLLNFFY